MKAENLGSDIDLEAVGWARVARRQLDSDMFVAKVVGRSMEPGIPDGAWGLFRSFTAGDQLRPTSLDGRRVVARIPLSKADSETGAYTLKRWKVTKVGTSGQVLEAVLRPDNKALESIVVTQADGDVRVVAEYLETLG